MKINLSIFIDFAGIVCGSVKFPEKSYKFTKPIGRTIKTTKNIKYDRATQTLGENVPTIIAALSASPRKNSNIS